MAQTLESIMTGTKVDDESRMGITLQGYDQVIALSQTNINQTLKRHFQVDEQRLTKFEAHLGSINDPENSLVGNIAAPTIQLVDAEKGDQAIYTIHFQSGATYMYWGAEPDNPRGAKTKKIVSAEGWTIAFFVSFAMEKAAQLPKYVHDVVMKEASYSAEQLVIVFGSADLITSAEDHCEFPSLASGSAALLEVQANMGKFIEFWLHSLRKAGMGKSHNILGYTVKVDVEGDLSQEQLKKKIGDSTSLSYPPTSVQFQTIAFKSDVKVAGDPSHPYNAFLFTEMTKGRPLPKNDLQWSGNWFYGGTGGTLNMSSGIFFQQFVGGLVDYLHREFTGRVETLVKRQTWTLMHV